MNVLPSKALVALLVAGGLCACTPMKRDTLDQPVSGQTYKPTGSHIVERSDGTSRRSPKNSSGAPVRDLGTGPAVTVIPYQVPK